MLCSQPFGRPVVPLEYMMNSGASAAYHTGATVFPRWLPSSSSMKTSRPSAIGVCEAYWPGVAAPDEHLVHLLPLLARHRDCLVGLDLVVRQLTGAVVTVHGDQDAAAGVGDPVPAGGAAEPAEHLGMNDAEPGARQHGDRQLGHHRHVQRHPVAGLQAHGITQHRSELIHLAEQVRVADLDVLVGLQLRHEDEMMVVTGSPNRRSA